MCSATSKVSFTASQSFSSRTVTGKAKDFFPDRLIAHLLGDAVSLSSLSPEKKSVLRAELGEHYYQEFLSLAQELDPKMFGEGLLLLAQRLADQDKLDWALKIYGGLQQVAEKSTVAGESVAALQEAAKKAEARQKAILGQGAVGARFEFLLKRFTKDATDFKTIIPMMAGSFVGQLAETAVLGRLAGTARSGWMAAKWAPRLIAAGSGYVPEFVTFGLMNRALAGVSEGGLQEELERSALSIGALKVMGFLGNRTFLKLHGFSELGVPTRLTGLAKFNQIAIPQFAMFSGMLLAHQLEAKLGLRQKTDDATTITDTLASMVSMGVGSRLGHAALGPGYSRMQQELGMRAGSYEAKSQEKPGGDISQSVPAGPGMPRKNVFRNPFLGPFWSLMGVDGMGGGDEFPDKYLDIDDRIEREDKTALLTALEDVNGVLPHLGMRSCYALACEIEKGVTSENLEVRQAAVKALHEIIPSLRLQDRLSLALSLEGRVSELDYPKQIREGESYDEIWNVLEGLIPFLVEKDRLALALKLKERLLEEEPVLAGHARHTLVELIHYLGEENRLTLANKADEWLVSQEINLREGALKFLSIVVPFLSWGDQIPLVEKIQGRLQDEDKGVRGEAANALGWINRDGAVGNPLTQALAIEAQLKEEREDRLLFSALSALGKITPHLAREDRMARALKIAGQLKQRHFLVQRFAIAALKKISPHLSVSNRGRLWDKVKKYLTNQLLDKDWNVRDTAFYIIKDDNLVDLLRFEIVKRLTNLFLDKDENTRNRALIVVEDLLTEKYAELFPGLLEKLIYSIDNGWHRNRVLERKAALNLAIQSLGVLIPRLPSLEKRLKLFWIIYWCGAYPEVKAVASEAFGKIIRSISYEDPDYLTLAEDMLKRVKKKAKTEYVGARLVLSEMVSNLDPSHTTGVAQKLRQAFEEEKQKIEKSKK